jgi:O-antigen/teichoic acid export membrane protein
VPIVTQICITLLIFFVLRKDILLGIKKGYIFLNPGDFKKIVIFGFKSHLGGTVQKANDQIATIIMAGVLSPESVGFYSLAIKAVNAFSVIKNAIGTALSPKIAQSNLNEIRSYFPQLLRTLLCVNLIIGVAIIVVLPVIIPFFYGSEFNPVIPIAIIITPGIILFPIALMIMVMFSQTGRPLVKGMIRAFGLVLNIILLIFLLLPYGPIGAAIATSVSYMIMFVVSVYMASRYIDLPYKRL